MKIKTMLITTWRIILAIFVIYCMIYHHQNNGTWEQQVSLDATIAETLIELQMHCYQQDEDSTDMYLEYENLNRRIANAN